MNIRITFDYPRQFPWLAALVDEEIEGAMEKSAEGQHAALGKQYALQDALASGKTFASYEISEIQRSGDRLTIELAPHGDRARAAEFIEYGRDPGKMPPPDVIRQWLIDRKIVDASDDPDYIDSLTYAVMKTISEYGVDPRPIFETATTQYAPSVNRIFEGAIRRIAAKINARLTKS
jgi:hypothetical protein